MSVAPKVTFKQLGQLSFYDSLIYNKLPQHPFWSFVEEKIDFSFVDRLAAPLYSGRGQRPYAPSFKFRIHLVQAYYNLTDRQTEEKIIGDLFIKRFLGLPTDFFGFDHSTIGLDRDRMGSFLFQACHLHILAQMLELGLWGDHNEQWIIDSFPSTAPVARVGAYRLIQQSILRVLQHAKRLNRPLYEEACRSLTLDNVTHRLPRGSTQKEWTIAFSKMVVQAYGLFVWLEHAPAFWSWKDKKAQLKSLELQALLAQILLENAKPYDPEPPEPSEPTDKQAAPTPAATVQSPAAPVAADAASPESGQKDETSPDYVKIPRNERPAHRIISAYDTDARRGIKKSFVIITGYKTQNLCIPSGVVLGTKAIPGSEYDGEAMVGMIRTVQSYFGVTPNAVLGDTLYGHGKLRVALKPYHIDVVAPVPASNTPAGYYGRDQFTYDRAQDLYRCPQGQETVRTSKHPDGHQYHFPKQACLSCPVRSECTSSKSKAKTVFHSQYYEEYEAARLYNDSEQGKADHLKRYQVERVNNQLKTHCGLGEPRTLSLETLDRKAKLAGIITNLKFTVRRKTAPKPGFLRRARKQVKQVG